MEINITYYGHLEDITNTKQETVHTQARTVEALCEELTMRYPKLKTVSFQVAQQNKIKKGEEVLTEHAVDLLPPFSGG